MREKRENVLLVKKFWNKVLGFFSPSGLSLNNRNVWPVVATPILTFPSQWAATQQTNTTTFTVCSSLFCSSASVVDILSDLFLFFKWTLRDFFVPTVWLLIPKLCSAYEKCITFIFFVESCPRPGGWDLITLSSRFVKHSTKVLKCWAGPPCDGQSRCVQNSEDVIEATHPGGVWTPLASVTSSQQEEDHFCNRSAANL